MPANIRKREEHRTPLTEWVQAAINKYRQESKKSLREIAAEADLQLPYLTNVRYGDRIPSWEKVLRLAKALGGEPSEAQDALWKTLEARRNARATRRKREEAEKKWTEAWREILLKYCPQRARPEKRADSIRHLVEQWKRLVGARRADRGMSEAAGKRPRNAPSTEVIGWLVLQTNDQMECVRREALNALGEFDPDLSVAAARAVIRDALLRDFESGDPARHQQAVGLCKHLVDLKDGLISAALLQRAFRGTDQPTPAEPEMIDYFALLKKKPPLIKSGSALPVTARRRPPPHR